MTLSQAEFEAHIVGSSSNVNIEPEQIPSDNVEGLIPTVEIQSQQPMNFNFDELSGLEPDQIPQSVREYQMNLIYHLHRVKVKVGGSIIVRLVIKATHNHIISKNIGKKHGLS